MGAGPNPGGTKGGDEAGADEFTVPLKSAKFNGCVGAEVGPVADVMNDGLVHPFGSSGLC